MAFGGKGFDGMMKQRMAVANQLWAAGISAETSLKLKPKFQQQFKEAEQNKIPLCIILGEDELAQNKVKIKQMGLEKDDPEKEGVMINRDEMIPEVRRRLAAILAEETLTNGVENIRIQDRDGVPSDAPAIPTAT